MLIKGTLGVAFLRYSVYNTFPISARSLTNVGGALSANAEQDQNRC